MRGGLVKADPFALGPNDITESSYSFYAGKYGATSVGPPPPNWLSVSKGFVEQSGDKIHLLKSFDSHLPPGYEAKQCGGTWSWQWDIGQPPSGMINYVGLANLTEQQWKAAPGTEYLFLDQSARKGVIV